MSYLRPESLNPFTINLTQAVTLGGLIYAAGMIAAGLSVLPAVGLGTGVMMTELGSGLLLGAVSLSGFLCARTAGKIRQANEAQLNAIHEAEKTGLMPEVNPYRLLDAAMERSPSTIALARFGGVAFGLIGALGTVGAVLAGAFTGPLLPTMLATLAIGMGTHKASRTAEEAVEYAEQTTRDASRALRNTVSPTQWSHNPEAAVGVEYAYPPAGHFVAKYKEEQALQEAALLEDGHSR